MKTLALDSLEEVREETGLETESGGSGYDGDGDTRRRRDGRRAGGEEVNPEPIARPRVGPTAG